MNKVVIILLFVALWTGSTRSIAFYTPVETLHAEQKNSYKGAIHAPSEWSITIMLEINADDSSASSPAEEETEDEDNTSKENVFHRTTSIHLSKFLQQLYARQNALFKEHHLEVEAPPPRG